MEKQIRPEEERTEENDKSRTHSFADLMVTKWAKGRKKHGAVVQINPLDEAKEECIDIANYAMDTFYRIERLQESLKTKE